MDINLIIILIYIGVAINFNSSTWISSWVIYGGNNFGSCGGGCIMLQNNESIDKYPRTNCPPKERIKSSNGFDSRGKSKANLKLFSNHR